MITGQNEMGGNVNPIHYLMVDIWRPLQEIPTKTNQPMGPRLPRYSKLVEHLPPLVEQLHYMKRERMGGVKRFYAEGVSVEYAKIGGSVPTEVLVVTTPELNLKICFTRGEFHFVWNSQLQHSCHTLPDHESRAVNALLRRIKEIA